ncbi:Gp49 family protein [Delftia tsuruhatensis]|uniref:Gp49 family protein n=1 Tax=Delftia tsuruhatensis TaxID=180282 RepID=UPI001CB8E844|nr:Gp49 family protein [Delftia tsuruhatensis]
MTFLKKHWQATAIVAIAALLIISGWRMFSQSAQIIDLGIFMLLGVALLLMPIAGLAEQILRKLGEQTVAVSSRERSHRQELELALAHGMGALVANPTFPGKSVGNNIRDALDAMLVQSAPASLAELRCGMNAYPGRADQHKCLVHGVAACPCHKASDDLMRSAGYEGEQAPASGGPRVTLADIEAEIVGEHYFTATQGAGHPEALNPRDFGDVPAELALLTICVLRLRNGTKLVGINYGAIDPDQHDADLGRKEARADAVEKIWELQGFPLRDKLAAGA